MFIARGALPLWSRSYPVPVANNNSTYSGLDNKFLIAFLLCFIFVGFLLFVLYLYARYLLRRNGHAASITVTGRVDIVRLHITSTSTNSPPRRGLDRSAIAALPTFAAPRNSEEECSVCLGVVADGEMVRLLPNCKHAFHVGCIDMWLCSHATCPVCRADVVPPASPEVCTARDEASVPKEGTSRMWWTRMLSSERQGRRGQGEPVHDIEMQ